MVERISNAEMQLKEGHIEDAKEICLNILRDHRGEFYEKKHVLRMLGTAYRRQKNYHQAVRILLKALKASGGSDAEVWSELSEAFSRNSEVRRPLCAAECKEWTACYESSKTKKNRLREQSQRLRIADSSPEEKAIAKIFLQKREVGRNRKQSTFARHVCESEKDLNRRLMKPRRVEKKESYLDVLRGHSSYTPIIEGRGGGYFLVHGGKGIIIDPGYGFIQNFLQAGYGFGDIHAIFVTHAHDDHVADLPAIGSILHKTNLGRKTDLYLDRTSFAALGKHYLLGGDQFSLKKRLKPKAKNIEVFNENGYSLTIDVYESVHKVDVLKLDRRGQPAGCKRMNSVGIGFRLGFPDESTQYILYPSDTAWSKKIERQYLELKKEILKIDLAILHVSSIKACEENWLIPGMSDRNFLYNQHLGLIGTIRFVERITPETVLLGERGAELDDLWDELSEVVAECCRYQAKNVWATNIGTRAIFNGHKIQIFQTNAK